MCTINMCKQNITHKGTPSANAHFHSLNSAMYICYLHGPLYRKVIFTSISHLSFIRQQLASNHLLELYGRNIRGSQLPTSASE